ncbi:MAG: type IV pilin protein [Methylococcaceae bacterium]
MLLTTYRPSSGFTLIEILITVIIVSILAIISVPSYQTSITKGRRAEAKATLMRLAQAEAKWRINHTTYADLTSIGGASANTDYIFAVTSNTASVFTITATPTSTNGQDHDVCSTLSITQDTTISSSAIAKCPMP